ncbi:unnamed protein product [marine sediment metagenome]|uniref:Uncharacterized protein n=1 Tax=marine sediment metagenome TaxID=412755 RepID=X1B8A2_9ZZZZ
MNNLIDFVLYDSLNNKISDGKFTGSIISKCKDKIIFSDNITISNSNEISISQGSNVIDFVTDEYGTSEEIDSLLQNFATQSIRFSNSNYVQTHTYLSKGAELLFRDAVFSRLKFIFRADDKYYEKHGLYDTFPQNDKSAKKMNDMLIPLIENNEDFRKKFYSSIKTEMVKPFKSIVENPNK